MTEKEAGISPEDLASCISAGSFLVSTYLFAEQLQGDLSGPDITRAFLGAGVFAAVHRIFLLKRDLRSWRLEIKIPHQGEQVSSH